jgi:hypothetical protein
MIAPILIAITLHLPFMAAHAGHVAQLVAGSGSPPPSGAPSNLGDALDKIGQIADFISSHFLLIGVALCTLVFGWGGLLWIVSGSSPLMRRAAISTWWHAAIGLIGVLAATPIVNSIKSFFS